MKPFRMLNGDAVAALAALLLACPAGRVSGMDAQAVLRAADRARGNLDGIEWRVRVEAEEGGRVTSETLHVRAAGYQALAVTEDPPARRGNTLLINDGRVWFHKPGLSRPIPISQRQRLLGLASYGDIATTDYAGQYDAETLPDETVDGEVCHVFDLRARAGGLMYDRIVWWVSRERHVGVKAAYYTRSGKCIKSARLWYAHEVELPDGSGQLMCSRIELKEELLSRDRTTLTFSKPVLAPLPESLFNINRLKP